MSNFRLNFIRSLVFVPSAIFVNDILMGITPVIGETFQGGTGNTDQKSWVLINRMSAKIHNGELQNGDMVVINDPYNSKQNLVRQVVRCGKEWIRVQDGDNEYHIYIQEGFCWVEEPPSPTNSTSASPVEQKYDSRTFGPISQGLIIGIPILVSWPLHRVGFFTLQSATLGEKK